MARRPGRPSGKDRDNLLRRVQRKYPKYHPVVALATLANDDTVPLELRIQCHKEVAQYVAPKRKAVEVKAEVTRSVSLLDMTGDGEAEALPATSIQ